MDEFTAGSFWYEGRNDVIAWALRRYFPHAAAMLEVGCGTGFVLARLRREFPALELTGGELDDPLIGIARQRTDGVELVQFDARTIPYENHFDVVGCFDVLEHIDEDELVLEEMRRSLRPGGGLLITVPQYQLMWSGLDELAGHARRYSRRELLGKVEAAGFEVLRVTSFVTALLPLMFASRLWWRLRRPADLTEELDLPPALQRVLLLGMKADLALIRRGVYLPAGGSLLAVARRPD